MKTVHQFKAWGIPRFVREGPDPDRRLILSTIEARRNAGAGPAVVRDERGETWGYMQLCVPLLDYAVLVAKNPELNSKDKETYDRAWRQFARSEIGRAYAADESIGKRKPNSRIIVK